MTQPASPRVGSSGTDQERIWESREEDGTTAAPALAGEPVPRPEAVAPPDAQARHPRPGRPGATWAQSLTSTAPLPGPAGFTFADVPNRIIAFILDVIVLAIIGVLLALVIGGAFGGVTSGGSAAGGSLDSAAGDLNVGAFLVVGIAALAISFAYFAYSWVVLRGTPGMKLLGLQIGDQADGRSISWDQALVRWLTLGIAATLTTFAVYVPSLLGLLLALGGFTWLLALLYTMAQSPTKQGLHDRYARTVLVRAIRRAA